MLHAMVMKGRPGTLNESIARRPQWQPPEGVNIVAEYWFPTTDPSVVAIAEADDPNALLPIRMVWDDLFEIEVFPVITAEEGLEMLGQMGSAR